MVWAFLLNIYKVSGWTQLYCQFSSVIIHQILTTRSALSLTFEFTLQVLATILHHPHNLHCHSQLHEKNVIQPQVLYWKHRSFPNKVLSKYRSHWRIIATCFPYDKSKAALTRYLMNINFLHPPLCGKFHERELCQKLK